MAAHERTIRERDALRAERDELRKALEEAGKCRRCGGDGRVQQSCPDPQCGDSTWDHECEAGTMVRCPDCEGSKLAPAARRALSSTSPKPPEPGTCDTLHTTCGHASDCKHHDQSACTCAREAGQ